jgi:hypothetical protein
MSMRLSRIEFGSLLSYSPRGNSEAAQRSRTTMKALKDDEFVSDPPVLMSDFIADTIRTNIKSLPFAHFFETEPVLVPAPRSSLMRPGTLWVPQRLAKALVRRGLGKSFEECLKRVTPLPKSATSLAANRPKAIEHYHSMVVQKVFPEPREILLVDDIITRGATVIGAANKLAEAFPAARIRVFAAMRTISPPDIFGDTMDPRVGMIELRNTETFRRP